MEPRQHLHDLADRPGTSWKVRDAAMDETAIVQVREVAVFGNDDASLGECMRQVRAVRGTEQARFRCGFNIDTGLPECPRHRPGHLLVEVVPDLSQWGAA